MALRRSSRTLHAGSYAEHPASGGDVYAFIREEGEERFLVAANLGDRERRVELGERGSIVLATEAVVVRATEGGASR